MDSIFILTHPDVILSLSSPPALPIPSPLSHTPRTYLYSILHPYLHPPNLNSPTHLLPYHLPPSPQPHNITPPQLTLSLSSPLSPRPPSRPQLPTPPHNLFQLTTLTLTHTLSLTFSPITPTTTTPQPPPTTLTPLSPSPSPHPTSSLLLFIYPSFLFYIILLPVWLFLCFRVLFPCFILWFSFSFCLFSLLRLFSCPLLSSRPLSLSLLSFSFIPISLSFGSFLPLSIPLSRLSLLLPHSLPSFFCPLVLFPLPCSLLLSYSPFSFSPRLSLSPSTSFPLPRRFSPLLLSLPILSFFPLIPSYPDLLPRQLSFYPLPFPPSPISSPTPHSCRFLSLSSPFSSFLFLLVSSFYLSSLSSYPFPPLFLSPPPTPSHPPPRPLSY
ncbi:hypothetical protein C7M84_012579 [Penaeus vannamei]|uniref:Uncharacterized protein n=1 Tax=Penaeus vannamei TaxID=6689 RepID=A0A3R7SP96_PENVA|nr:hypothetical protein C7M84_012579 [Penaeus vannamei]